MTSESPSSQLDGHKHALWVASQPISESAAVVRFLLPDEGELALKAPGLLKAQSKLAPLLKHGDELRITAAKGRSKLGVLTGVAIERQHHYWRERLDRLALLWFMLEGAATCASTPQSNASTYQLVVNLIRSEPPDEELYSCLGAFCIKLLAIHGLMPDLLSCSITGEYLQDGEPSFLLPNGEGLVGLEGYNSKYARSAANLLRVDPARRKRWLELQHGPLMRYGARNADPWDAWALLELCRSRLEDITGRRLGSAEYLSQQWRLTQPGGPAD